MGRRFERELSLWGASDTVHMMLIATFCLNDAGVPTIEELSLMPVTGQWLPIEDSFEQQLVERLVRDGRLFVKGLRYNLPLGQPMASAILTDAGATSIPLCIESRDDNGEDLARAIKALESAGVAPAWIWLRAQGAIPPLPRRLLPDSAHMAGR